MIEFGNTTRCTTTVVLIFTFLSQSHAATVYVSETGPFDGDGLTWQTAYRTIGEALTASASGDAIWVRSGTYEECIDLTEGVGLFGGFSGVEGLDEFHLRDFVSNETIIDGSGLNKSVVSAVGIGAATLDGFTVTHGFALFGGGVHVDNSSPLLRHLNIVSNTAERWGGGVNIQRDSSPLIENCTITQNHVSAVSDDRGGGGVTCAILATPIFRNTMITKNSSNRWGAGLYSLGRATPTLEDCSLSANYGDGFYAAVDSGGLLDHCSVSENVGHGIWGSRTDLRRIGTTILLDCIVSGNQGIGVVGASLIQMSTIEFNVGGGVDLFEDSVVEGCLILGNDMGGISCRSCSKIENTLVIENGHMEMADGIHTLSDFNGAGIHIQFGDPLLSHCTVSRNNKNGFEGGVYFDAPREDSQAVPRMVSCIVWNNSTRDLPAPSHAQNSLDIVLQTTRNGRANPTITYSDIGGVWRDEGNISSDPMFVDPEGGDFRLLPCSPCIDSASRMGPSGDRLGNSRPLDIPGLGREGTGDEFDMGAFESVSGQLPECPPTATPATGSDCDSGYYLLDALGARHRVGIPQVVTGSLYFGTDIAVDLERASRVLSGASEEDLVVLDGYGAAHFVEHPTCNVMQTFYFGDVSMEDFPRGRAVDLVMAGGGQGFWALTDYGGIYRAGTSLPPGENGLLANSDQIGFLGFDVPFGNLRDPNLPEPGGASLRAVGLSVVDFDHDNLSDGYLVLDSQGGRFHLQPDGSGFSPGASSNLPESDPMYLLDPVGYAWPFFAGLDIARDMELHWTEQGAMVFDGWGGTHPVPVDIESNPVYFANNRTSNSDPTPVSTVGLPYITTGFDDPMTQVDENDGSMVGSDAASIFADLEFSGCPEGLYTMDRFGGVFAFGNARSQEDQVGAPFTGSPYFFPQMYARDIEVYATDELEIDEGEPFDILTIELPNLSRDARPLRMVRIPAGSFQMGGPQGSGILPNPNESPIHDVTLEYEFYMAETEITQGQWEAVTGRTYRDQRTLAGLGNASIYKEGADYPIVYISWEEVQEFIDQLNTLGQGRFRLPSESEWEYSCRAGTQTSFYFGDSDECPPNCEDCAAGDLPGNRSDYLWYCGNLNEDPTRGSANPVALLLPNAFGLYDMHGNVSEWCQDCFQLDIVGYEGAPTDGSAWEEGGCGIRISRSGRGWLDIFRLTSFERSAVSATDRRNWHGLRIVRDIEE